jgi:hypothetical protein
LLEGAETDIMCLELGDSAMLLLQKNPGLTETYHRLGVCTDLGNRRAFFYGCEVKQLLLA